MSVLDELVTGFLGQDGIRQSRLRLRAHQKSSIT